MNQYRNEHRIDKFVRCDFCSVRDVRWRFPCETFDILGLDGKIHRMFDEWLACDQCKALVETNSWNRLHQRSDKAQFAREPQLQPYMNVVRKQRSTVWREFRRHRQGDPVAYE